MTEAENYFKLVVTGSVNAGKTTFIRTISEIEPITTDEWATEESVKALKSQTTVAMDYGRRTIEEITLNIYGTPGQERFYFMWDVLVEGAFGVIFLADSTDYVALESTRLIIAHFLDKYRLPYLLCVTKLDLPNSIGYDKTIRFIDRSDILAVPCKPIDKEDVKNALITLLTLALDEAESDA
jgi:uncharacterized protein